MSFNPDIHHRRTLRLRDYDYSGAGAYFMTICSFQRECLFGEVMDGVVRLTPFGEIVREEWKKSETVRENIILDEFVVMPNHLHGIVVVIGNVGATQRVAPTGRAAGSIGAVIGQFKSAATKRINRLRDNPGCPVLQRNYHDRVIRTEKELANVRQYIADNPAKWNLDESNPVNVTKIS